MAGKNGKSKTVKVGDRFGRILVTAVLPHCKAKGVCDCGANWKGCVFNLLSSNTKSCGCLNQEKMEVRHKEQVKHGLAGSLIYARWTGILDRCKKSKIKVCEYLKVDPRNLVELLGLPNEEKPSIDRYPIHNGNYTCGDCFECIENDWKLNVRWASYKEQVNNRGPFNTHLTAFGKTMTVAEWRDLTGLGWMTINCRIKRGFSPEDALTMPDRRGNCYKPDGKVLWTVEQAKERLSKTLRDAKPHTKKLTAFGRTEGFLTWSKLSGICYSILRHRQKIGWSPEEIVGTPNRKGQCYKPDGGV